MSAARQSETGFGIELVGTFVPVWVRVRPDADGSWTTRHQRDAKVWKTLGGAQRWLAERPGVGGKIIVVAR